MVDPFAITNFERNEAELQEFLLFCVCVSGKTAVQQAAKLDDALYMVTQGGKLTPFEALSRCSPMMVELVLRIVKMGQYRRIVRAFSELAKLSGALIDIDIQAIEAVPGVGPKTSRFFVLHSRPGANVACLDTHILKYMREHMGVAAPKSTPDVKKYRQLEAQFLEHCELLGRTPAELDLEIWASYAKARPAAPDVAVAPRAAA